MTDIRITLDNGKYELVIPEKGGMHALRHGEEWRDLVGDNLIFFLGHKVQDLEVENERLKATLPLTAGERLSLNNRIEELEDEVEGLENEVEELTKHVDHYQNKWSKCNSHKHNISRQSDEYYKQLSVAVRSNEDLQAENEKLWGDIKTERAFKEANQTGLKVANKVIDTLQSQITTLNTLIDEIEGLAVCAPIADNCGEIVHSILCMIGDAKNMPVEEKTNDTE